MQYNLAQVISVYTGRLMIPMDDLYDTLSKMLNYDLFTHQIPPAAAAMRPHIKAKYPELPEKLPDWVNDEKSVYKWLDENKPVYGDVFELESIKVPENINELLTKFVERRGSEAVIPVIVDG